MLRYIFVSFLFMGWGYYELSGGNDFKPMSQMSESELAELGRTPLPLADIEQASVRVTAIEPATSPEIVTRAATITLASLSEVEPTPAVAASEPEIVEEVAVEIMPTPEPTLLLRTVAGNRVNMRSGPGTDYGVVTTLTRGELAEVLETNDNGWMRLRVIATDQVGWMAERLLNDPA
jgi:hypothetical protein